MTDKASVFGHAQANGYAHIGGNAKVYNEAIVTDRAEIFDDADIFDTSAFLTIRNIGRYRRTVTFFNTEDGKIKVGCGCFRGTLDEFAQRVDSEHGDNEHGKAYRLAIELAKLLVNTNKDAAHEKKPKEYHKFKSGLKCTVKEYEYGKEMYRKHPHRDEFCSVEDVIRLKRSLDQAAKGKYIKCF